MILTAAPPPLPLPLDSSSSCMLSCCQEALAFIAHERSASTASAKQHSSHPPCDLSHFACCYVFMCAMNAPLAVLRRQVTADELLGDPAAEYSPA